MTNNRVERQPENGSRGARSISLEQLIVLNDEIAALVRAGVPLERGLIEFGLEVPGRLGEIALRLGGRIQAGESLDEILLAEESQFSPIWRAVVAAGMRSGQFAAALEGLSTTARRVSEMKQSFRAALIYPLVVVTLAFALFVFTVTYVAPAIVRASFDLTTKAEPVSVALAWLGLSARWWVPVVLLLSIVSLFIAWMRSRRVTWTSSRELANGSLRQAFSIRQVLQDGQMATFAELLALLIRQGVPMAESLELAGAASGNASLAKAGNVLAERVRGGQILAARDAQAIRFPPLLGWMLTGGSRDSTLAETLSSTAERYRERAARGVALSRFSWPLLATAVVGGTVTLLYGVVVFAPICRLLYALGTS